MSDKAAGFTLLEVLVALVIAALGLVVMFQAGGAGLLAVTTSSRADEAVERAQSHLAAIGHDVALLQGTSTGDDGGGYRWSLRIAPVASRQQREPNPGASVTMTLFDVEVAISWEGGGHRRSVVLKTRRLGTAVAVAP